MAQSIRQKQRQSWSPPKVWITFRKSVQYLALLITLAFFVLSQNAKTEGDFVNIPVRLDPLLTLSHLLSSRIFLLASTISLVTVLLTFVFGRAWCGWLCPLGTILDLFSMNRWRRKYSTVPHEGWRRVKYILLLIILAAALFGNLSLLIFDPITILFRTLSTSVWPALDQVILAAEGTLYRIPALAKPVTIFDSWVRPLILPSQPMHYRNAVLFALIFTSIIALNLVQPRFWCRYLCPLGGLLGILSKFAIIRRGVSEGCKGCNLCEKTCPTGTIDPENNYASDPSECTMCLDCLESCPRNHVEFKAHVSLAQWNEYDPGRREVLAAIGTAIAGIALFRSTPYAFREPSHSLRPPGARENDFIQNCIRCAECIRACPTSGLQPGVTETGLEGLWTPILVPRLGYCDYSCIACGQICPVEAIPSMSLEEKRQQVIGKAYINTDRCIPWSDHQDCIVCEEMCPIPDKAIYLEEVELKLEGGGITTVQLPYVNRELCIGCGICEFKCPLNGDAAIRIHSHNL